MLRRGGDGPDRVVEIPEEGFVRTEGKAQYVEVAGGFAHYLDDPWADSGFAREAVNEAAKTVRGIETVEVAQSKAVVQNNKLTEYQVLVRIGFRIEGAGSPTASKKKA